MKLPRDLSGVDLSKALRRLGHELEHQRGSHMRLVTRMGGEHPVTIPDRSPLRIGTLHAILRLVGEHAGLDREQLLRRLFD